MTRTNERERSLLVEALARRIRRLAGVGRTGRRPTPRPGPPPPPHKPPPRGPEEVR